MSTTVSILIPAYNAERWIADAIQSALNQTWPHKELVVVDDGSTDRTLDIARRFAAHNVLVLRQDNAGAAAARNRAYSACQGDFIQWLDADDLLAPDKLALQMAEFDRVGDITITFSGEWGRFLHRWHRARFIRTVLWEHLSPAEWLRRKLGQNVYMANSAWLVSREVTDTAGPWNETLAVDDDGEYFARIVLRSSQVRFVPGARTYYRSSAFGTVSDIGQARHKLEAHLRAMQLQIMHLRSLDDSPATREACVAFLQSGMSAFGDSHADLKAQARAIAQDLGGHLLDPKLSWKYNWLSRPFGPQIARRAATLLPRARSSVVRTLDRALLHLERVSRPKPRLPGAATARRATDQGPHA
jgi:glycosyltransferase involved in cell wall biosynthesis